MLADRYLTVHGLASDAWAERFGLLPFTAPCDLCGEPLSTTQPIAAGSLRGLRAPPCSCGNTSTPYCLVRDARFGDLFSGS